jgi:DNA modification methylase
MEIEEIDIDLVVPYEKNPRINTEAIDKVAASINEFGWQQPIVIDKDGVVIAGHTRLLAAKKLGLVRVPVHYALELSESQVKAYRLADNRLNQDSEWNLKLLAGELTDLADMDFELGVIGFTDDELKTFMHFEELEPPPGDPDEVPPLPATPTTVIGDLYLLGKHRLLCGDSTNINSLERLLDGEKADMVFTDPPYNANFKSNFKKESFDVIKNDNMSEEDFDNFLAAIFNSMLCVVRPGASIYSCINWQNYPQMLKAFKPNFKHVVTIIWDKKHFGMGVISGNGPKYRPQYEMIIFGLVGDADPVWNAGHDERNVWSISRDSTLKYDHPTQKPVEIVERAVNNSSNQGDIILDMFGGSGTTLVACEITGRRARLIELEPKYCDVIVKRYEDLTGKKAVLCKPETE